MNTARDIFKNLMERITNMHEFNIKLRMDNLITNGPLPFDITFSDGIVTAKVYALSIGEAKQQVSDYFNSDDFVE